MKTFAGLVRTASALGCLWTALAMLSPAAAFQTETKLTRAHVDDRDVGQSLAHGLTASFERDFPERAYGIYVLVDNIDMRDGREFIYINLGLSRRLPNGQFLAPHATYSGAVIVAANEPPQMKADKVRQALADNARQFAAVMEQNRAAVH